MSLGVLAPRAQETEPRASGWNGLPAFVWRAENPGKPLSAKLTEAFGGVNIEGTAEDDWACKQGLDFYVGHAPGRNALHIDTDRDWYKALWELYWEERDPEKLVRIPCLSEEATTFKLFKQLDASFGARSGNYGLAVSLGDEVSLTPYGAPLDLCQSASCVKSFEFFLNRSETWSFLASTESSGVPYPDTDQTRLAWIAGDPVHVPAWLARRAFHHQAMIDVLAKLAQRSRKIEPKAPIALFGQSGRTAFGDIGVEDLLTLADVIEVYRILDSRELLYTLRGEDQRSLLTLFPEEQAPAGATWIAWEHWMRGGDAFVLWSDRELEADANYFKSMRETLACLRTLKQQWPEWRPRPAGVAVLHDPNSLALSWLRDALNDGPTWMRRYASYQNEHGTREVLLQGILRLLEDSGFMPGAVLLDHVDANTVSSFPILIASQVLIVSDKHRAGLSSFIKAGGQLIINGDFDTFDVNGVARETEPLVDHDAFQLDGKRYLSERWSARAPQAYANIKRAELTELCQSARSKGPSWTVHSEDFGGPWLRYMQPGTATDEWLCVAIPNASLESERADLRKLEVRVDGYGEYELKWVQPNSAGTSKSRVVSLGAGEAIVFSLKKP